jgi:hypothetical protein
MNSEGNPEEKSMFAKKITKTSFEAKLSLLTKIKG